MHSGSRALTTDLPAGLREEGMELTSADIPVAGGGREWGDGVMWLHVAPDIRWR
jgi:hypothetical protein